MGEKMHGQMNECMDAHMNEQLSVWVTDGGIMDSYIYNCFPDIHSIWTYTLLSAAIISYFIKAGRLLLRRGVYRSSVPACLCRQYTAQC